MSTTDVGDVTRLGITFTDLDGDPVDPDTVTLKIKTPAGVVSTFLYGTDNEVEKDTTGVYFSDLPITEAGTWTYRWVGTGQHAATENGTFAATPDPFADPVEPSGRFATVDDVAARLGVEFSDAQEQTVELLLGFATGLVAAAVDEDDAWAAALTPIPSVVRAVTIESVRRGYLNPDGLTSRSEQLGQYQHSERYAASAGSMELTTSERLQLRRALLGSTFQSISLVTPYSGDDTTDDESELPLD